MNIATASLSPRFLVIMKPSSCAFVSRGEITESFWLCFWSHWGKEVTEVIHVTFLCKWVTHWFWGFFLQAWIKCALTQTDRWGFLYYSSVTVRVTASQHARHQDPEMKVAKLKSAIINSVFMPVLFLLWHVEMSFKSYQVYISLNILYFNRPFSQQTFWSALLITLMKAYFYSSVPVQAVTANWQLKHLNGI